MIDNREAAQAGKKDTSEPGGGVRSAGEPQINNADPERYHDLLERMVEERTEELRQANEQLRREVAERRRAEEEVRELGQFLEMVIDNANIWLNVLDQDRRIVLWNKAAEEISGYSREEVLGNDGIWAWLYPDASYRKDVFERVIAILEKGETLEDFETTIRSRDGLPRVISWHSKPLLNRDGLPMGSIALGRDVTEVKTLEAQLRRAQKLESIGTLAGGIAHDFNNILGIIFGYAEMALEESPRDGPLRNYIQEVLKASRRARDVVKQVLAFSTGVDSEARPIRMGPIVKDVLALMRETIPSSIQIAQDISSDALLVADPVQIHEIVAHLCTNALHAMGDKGGLLKVKLQDMVLYGGALKGSTELQPGPYVQLTVSDTGHGMDTAVMERIFDPYFTTRPVGEGSGLGLAAAHGMVRKLKGAIEVHSEPGQGTTFTVFLPSIAQAQKGHTHNATTEAWSGRGHVLFVDDEKGLVRVGSEMLKRLGYSVTSTTNALEALELFQADPHRYDVVVTDQTMPEMLGVELAKKMLSLRTDMPIILCTGFSETVNEEKARKIGIRRFIMKPVLIRELSRVIEEVMGEDREAWE